jgi:DNA processing protein
LKLTEFLLRLKFEPTIGYIKMLQVVTMLGCPAELERADLLALDLPAAGRNHVLHAFASHEFARKVAQVRAQCEVIGIGDALYPDQLRQIYRPPLLLFARGNTALLKEKITVIVGARYPTKYSQEVLGKLVPNLVQDKWVIASGLARGVDAEAHQAALAAQGLTIAVIGNGLNYFYPSQNRHLQQKIARTGLVLSEYLPDTPPRPYFFPARNRILAGLSQNVIVTEAKEKSGSLITANLALQENRNIFAVPGPVSSTLSRGPNLLIAAGATPLVDYELPACDLNFDI